MPPTLSLCEAVRLERVVSILLCKLAPSSSTKLSRLGSCVLGSAQVPGSFDCLVGKGFVTDTKAVLFLCKPFSSLRWVSTQAEFCHFLCHHTGRDHCQIQAVGCQTKMLFMQPTWTMLRQT